MLRYIIISDKKENIQEYEFRINKLMIDCDTHYEIHVFEKCNQKLDDLCKDLSGSTVYIVDHSKINNSESIIYKIRKVYKHYVAFLIIMDREKELNRVDLISKYSFLCDVIDGYDKNKLISDLKYILNIVYNRRKILIVNYEKCVYRIPFRDILYIEKEINSKRCMIVCKNNVFKTYKSIVQLEKLLDGRFVKTHQSAIININHVKEIDFANSRIIFDDELECNLLSRNMKKKLKEAILNK